MAAKTSARARTQQQRRSTTSLTQLTILDALRTWVVPAVTLPGALIIYVLYNVEMVERELSVTILGVLTLITLVWLGVRGFIHERTSQRTAVIVGAYALMWMAATTVPFLALVDPGSPIFSAPLHANDTVTLPLENRPGEYRLVVEGAFAPTSGQSTRLAHYRLSLRGGGGEQSLEGRFSERFLQQRLGRRGSATVRDLHTATQHDVVSDGTPLTLALSELAPIDTINSVTVHLYPERFPKVVFVGVAILLAAGAVVVDAWRSREQTSGLLTTITLGAVFAIAGLRWWGGPHPGFGQLAVEGLIGGVAGSLTAVALDRLVRPLLRRLPAAP
ncbi:MAG TPA: hypothetical protein VMW17_05465 [Candidatus Binatia bacterium]|nr:hypothetical protein [Candidatus Binatia bacterium]